MISMKRKIGNDRLKEAAFHAVLEARRWKAIALRIENEKGLLREQNVIYAYAIELCFKIILMINGVNITKINLHNGHDLLSLFDLLPDGIKNDIKKQLELPKIEVKDFFTGKITETCTTFEDILKLVSNDFFEKRYVYEKYANGEAIRVVDGVLNLIYEYAIQIANRQINEYLDEIGHGKI